MVVQFQTAFIPKKGQVIAPPTVGFGKSVNLFGIIALCIFLVTAGLAATVYFYKGYLISSIGDMDGELARARKSFEPEFIDAAARLNARIEAAQELLNSHRAVSPVFDVLEKKTLESVRFKDFNFTAAPGGLVTVSMTGEAKSFNAVALQSDVFGTERSFRDPVFANFNLNDSGDVIFNFTATVNPDLILYRETVIKNTGIEEDEEASDGVSLEETSSE